MAKIRKILAICGFPAPHVSKGISGGSLLSGPLPDGRGLE